MTNNNLNPNLRGQELVLEFIEETKASCGNEVVDKLVMQIFEEYHCPPADLKISDEQANKLIDRLYWIACEQDLKTAMLPMTSR